MQNEIHSHLLATIKEQYTEAAAVVATACFSSSCLWKVLVANYSGHLISLNCNRFAGHKKSPWHAISYGAVRCSLALRGNWWLVTNRIQTFKMFQVPSHFHERRLPRELVSPRDLHDLLSLLRDHHLWGRMAFPGVSWRFLTWMMEMPWFLCRECHAPNLEPFPTSPSKILLPLKFQMIIKKESCDPEQATTGYQQRREAQSLQSPAVPPPKLHAHVPGAGFCDFSSMIQWSWYRWQGKIVNDNNTIKMKCQQIFSEIVKQHLWPKAVAFHSRPQAGAVAAGFPSWAFLAQPRLGHNQSAKSFH